MLNASARCCAVLSVLVSLCWACPGASACDRTETPASVTIVQPATVTVVNTVVNNAPLQTILLTVAIAPVGVVFTGSASAAVSAAGSGATGGGGPVGSPANGAGAGFDGAVLPASDGADPAGLMVFSGSLSGTTIAGDAVSVSVGSLSGGTGTGTARVSVVIAQYN